MVLLISYDLLGHERPSAYNAVKATIERYAISSQRPLYSQWFVETTESSEAWKNRLKAVMDDNDRLFVCRVTTYSGWLSKPIWEWLHPRL